MNGLKSGALGHPDNHGPCESIEADALKPAVTLQPITIPMNRRTAITVLRSRRDAFCSCLLAATALACSGGLFIAALLLHPPVAVDPLIVLVCIGCPVFGTWELSSAIASLRAGRVRGKRMAVVQFRRSLARLPEVEHPLGR
jgi:hypothetical protein